MMIMFSDNQHLVAYQQSVKPGYIQYCIWKCLMALRSILSEPVGHFHFCHFLPLFAGSNWLKPAGGKKHFLPAEMPTLLLVRL